MQTARRHCSRAFLADVASIVFPRRQSVSKIVQNVHVILGGESNVDKLRYADSRQESFQ